MFQKRSSAAGGLDFEQNGFYAGTWTADVGDTLIDLAISIIFANDDLIGESEVITSRYRWSMV